MRLAIAGLAAFVLGLLLSASRSDTGCGIMKLDPSILARIQFAFT